MISIYCEAAKAFAIVVRGNLIEIGDLADEGIGGLNACIVDCYFPEQFGERDLYDEAL